LGAIAQALRNPRAFSDSGVVRSYFKSMGGYLTISERKFKSIMQVANALREMFGNSTITPVHIALAFYLTIPFTPELKNIISPIVLSIIKSYFDTNTPKSTSVGIKSIVNSISQISKNIFANEDLNKLLNDASAYAIDVITHTFPASTPELAQYRASLISKFSAVANNTTTPQKLVNLTDAINILSDVATMHSNNVKVRTTAQRLLRYFGSAVATKIDVDRIEQELMAEFNKVSETIKAEIERKLNELATLGDSEFSRLVAGVRKFFPQFSEALPPGVGAGGEKEKEKIMEKVDDELHALETEIEDFIIKLREVKEVLSQLAK